MTATGPPARWPQQQMFIVLTGSESSELSCTNCVSGWPEGSELSQSVTD